MLKKLMGIMLAFILTLSLTGCSFFEDDSSKGNSNTSDTSKDDSGKKTPEYSFMWIYRQH